MTATTTSLPLPKGRPPRSILPGFGLSLGILMAGLGLVLLLPAAGLLSTALTLGPGGILALLGSRRALGAFEVSLGCAAAAALTAAVFGLLIAWVLVRTTFPGRRLADAMVDLPFALPTSVAGIALSNLYAPHGWLGSLLAPFGIRVSFTLLGIYVALTFVGLPFVVRSLQPVLQDLEADQEEAAHMLGAGRWQTFARIIFPAIRPALTAGFAMAFARGFGEYGSVIFISSNRPGISEIVPLLIVNQLEDFDFPGAATIGMVMLLLSFAFLLVILLLQRAVRRGRHA